MGKEIKFGDQRFTSAEYKETLPKCKIHDRPDCDCVVSARNHAIIMSFDNQENLLIAMREVRTYVSDDAISEEVPTEHVLNIPPWYLHDFKHMLDTMVNLANAGFKTDAGSIFEILDDREDPYNYE